MSTQSTFDYIIVGQGLAGSCLALQLINRGKKILVIDKTDQHAATRVAAGLFNPITGKVMSKTWMADILFPYLREFYTSAEKLTNNTFFHSMPLYRPFVSIEEQNEWMGRSEDSKFAEYIDRVLSSAIDEANVQNKFGGLLLKNCGYLDTTEFSNSVRNYIRQCSAFIEGSFHEEELKIDEGGIQYLNHRAKKIILCQGESACRSKFFSWLPIRPLKGETLTIQTKANVSKIYNRGVYVVPGTWKVGATYQFKDITRTTTEEGLKELVEKLNELVSFHYEVVDQAWGMRPTTPDRRPILGAHPQYDSVLIFNGLGTKGVSLAPYFSKVLAEWLENGVPLNKEVDIHRYKHYNYGGNLSR